MLCWFRTWGPSSQWRGLDPAMERAVSDWLVPFSRKALQFVPVGSPWWSWTHQRWVSEQFFLKNPLMIISCIRLLIIYTSLSHRTQLRHRQQRAAGGASGFGGVVSLDGGIQNRTYRGGNQPGDIFFSRLLNSKVAQFWQHCWWCGSFRYYSTFRASGGGRHLGCQGPGQVPSRFFALPSCIGITTPN